MTPGIVQHPTFTGSGAAPASRYPAMWDAEQCKRQAVTVAFAYEHLCDEPVWLWSDEMSECGMDPWVQVGGIDRSTRDENEFFLDYGRTGTRRALGSDVVFAQVSTLRRLGLIEVTP